MREYKHKYYLNLIKEYVASDDQLRVLDIGEIFKVHAIDLRVFPEITQEIVDSVNANPHIFANLKRYFALNAKQLRQLLAVAARCSGPAFQTILQNSGFNPRDPKDFCGVDELDHSETVAVCVAAGARVRFRSSWHKQTKLAYFLAILAHGTQADIITAWIDNIHALEFSDAEKINFVHISTERMRAIQLFFEQDFVLQEIPHEYLMVAARELFDEAIYDGSQPQVYHIEDRARFIARRTIREKFTDLVDWVANKKHELATQANAAIRTTQVNSAFEDLCKDVGLDPFMFNAYVECSLHRYVSPNGATMAMLHDANSQSLQAMLDGEADDVELRDNIEFFLASLLRIHKFNTFQEYESERANLQRVDATLTAKIDNFIRILARVNNNDIGRINAAKIRVQSLIQDLITHDRFDVEGTELLGKLIELAEEIAANTATAEKIHALFNNPTSINNRYSVRYFPVLKTFLSVTDLVNFLEIDSAAEMMPKIAKFHQNLRAILPIRPKTTAAAGSSSAAAITHVYPERAKRSDQGTTVPHAKRARETEPTAGNRPGF